MHRLRLTAGAGPQSLADRGSECEDYIGEVNVHYYFHRDIFNVQLEQLAAGSTINTVSERLFMEAVRNTSADLQNWNIMRGFGKVGHFCGPQSYVDRKDPVRMEYRFRTRDQAALQPRAQPTSDALQCLLCCRCGNRRRVDAATFQLFSAENWQHGEDEEFLSAIMPVEPLSAAPEPGDHKEERRNILIFHCEFSSQRAPDFYKKLRERDRNLHENVYPALHYPECYLLHLGYKEFFNNYPDLCTGRYTEMVDPRYGNELRIMRAKSKSWSGGTVSRTGTMSRKFQRY